ncbi:MAG TPA: phosphatidylglycerophosphatase A [Blastocatellia bacterium]|nr:phosphatidylglycerophosphatase A [Blastocatellia bacterium]
MSSAQPAKRKTTTDRIAYALATGLGAGFAPIAPGTIGSVEGLVIFLAVLAFHPGLAASLVVLASLNMAVFAVGVWASTRTCEITALKDPGIVVIDEVSGQLIALTPLALWPSFSVAAVVAGFILFRFFDIFKPYPIRKLEHLHAGLGVMADDALAGIYAAVLLWLGHIARLI